MSLQRGTALWLAGALLATLAIGASAAALDATVTSDPEDALDVDYQPLGQALAEQVPEQVEDSAGESTDSPDDDSEGTEERPAEHRDGGETDGEMSAREGGPDERGGSEEQPEDESILAPLLSYVRSLLPILAIVAIGAIVFRSRTQLIGLVHGLRPAPDVPAVTTNRRTRSLPRDLNAVEAAWAELATSVDPDDLEAMTTAELARTAIRDGYDPDAVWQITNAFEELSYGNASVTEAQAERSRESARVLRREGRKS